METAVEQPGRALKSGRVPWWWWIAAVLAVAIALYSLRYAFFGEAAYVPELAPSFRERALTVTVHTLFGPIALVVGLVNLLPAMRQGEFLPAYRWVAWLSWVPNALFVESIIRHGWRPKFAAPDGFAST